ncbi:MAG: hypothetical protein ACLGIZ_09060 [Acidimicrobiia bacterium]
MQSPTTAPLRALAIATALVAGTGVAAAAMVPSADDTKAQTVHTEMASNGTDLTPPTPVAAPAPAPAGPDGAAQMATPAPAEEVPPAAGSASQSDVEGYAIDTVDELTGRLPVPISRSTLVNDQTAAVAADVVALLPDREALTAAVTACIDELRTLVPELPSEIDPDAGLRGLVGGMFDRMRDSAPLPQPDSAAIAESIDVCVTSLQGVLPAPEELMTLIESLAAQADLPPELTALVEQLQPLFDQMQQSGGLATIDPSATLDALRSLMADDGSADSPTIGILEALLGGIARAG